MADLYWIDQPQRGRVAIAPRPRGGDWLGDDLKRWRREGVDVVVSMLTDDECAELQLQDESAACAREGMLFHRLPVPDRGVPAGAGRLGALVEQVNGDRFSGKNVLVHCRQGIGRSSMVACSLLMTAMDAPLSEEQAWSAIERARGRPVPDTPEQRAWVDAHLGFWTRLLAALRPHGLAMRQQVLRLPAHAMPAAGSLGFMPLHGPRAGHSHVVVLAWDPVGGDPAALLEKLLEIRDCKPTAMAFAGEVPAALASHAHRAHVATWAGVARPEDLAARVTAWATTPLQYVAAA